MNTTGKFSLRVILLVMVLGVFGQTAHALVCDVNHDGVVDLTDINLIVAARNAPVPAPTDLRDPDGDGTVTVLDARFCVTKCTRPGCAVSGNRSPIANAGPDQTVLPGATVTLNGAGSSDPDGNALTYAWSFFSRPTGSGAVLQRPTAVNPTFVVDVHGTYIVQLIVNDGTVNSAPDMVQISTENSRPIAQAGPDQTVSVEQTVHLNGSGSSDPDGNLLTFTWSLLSVPAGSTTQLQNPHTINPTFYVDKPGVYDVQLIVNDGFLDSAPDTVTISTGNTAPVANAGPNQTVTTGATVQLNGSGSTDVDGQALTYQWALVSRPAGSTATLSTPTAVNPTFAVDIFGVYVVQLIVNDGIANSAPATVTITTLNKPPVANAGPSQFVLTGSIVHLDGSASSDPDGQALTYQWSFTSRPAGSAAALSNPTTVNPTFTVDVFGTYVVQLIVNDGIANSAPATVTISTDNVAPVANAGPDQTVAAGATVQLNGGGSSTRTANRLRLRGPCSASPPEAWRRCLRRTSSIRRSSRI